MRQLLSKEFDSLMINFTMKNFCFVAAVNTILLLTGCTQPKANLKAEQEKITFVWTDWTKKSLTGNPDSLAYYYADDALIIGTDPEVIKGKAAAVKVYADAPVNFELDIKWDDNEKPNIIQFSDDGSMAYSLDGNAVPVPDSSGAIRMQRNKVLHLWKKDTNGNWRVSLLMMYPER